MSTGNLCDADMADAASGRQLPTQDETRHRIGELLPDIQAPATDQSLKENRWAFNNKKGGFNVKLQDQSISRPAIGLSRETLKHSLNSSITPRTTTPYSTSKHFSTQSTASSKGFTPSIDDIVKAAVNVAVSKGKKLLGAAIEELYIKGKKDPECMALIEAVLSANRTKAQLIEFKRQIMEAKQRVKARDRVPSSSASLRPNPMALASTQSQASCYVSARDIGSALANGIAHSSHINEEVKDYNNTSSLSTRGLVGETIGVSRELRILCSKNMQINHKQKQTSQTRKGMSTKSAIRKCIVGGSAFKGSKNNPKRVRALCEPVEYNQVSNDETSTGKESNKDEVLGRSDDHARCMAETGSVLQRVSAKTIEHAFNEKAKKYVSADSAPALTDRGVENVQKRPMGSYQWHITRSRVLLANLTSYNRWFTT